MRAGERGCHTFLALTPTSPAASEPQTDDFALGLDETDFVRRLTQFGDWGGPCFEAQGTYLWPLHLEFCAHCRAVQARWDAERGPVKESPKPVTVNLSSYLPELEPAPVVELPVLTEAEPCEMRERCGVKPKRRCSKEGCDRPHYGRGPCAPCYRAWYQRNAPLKPPEGPPPTVDEVIEEMRQAYARALEWEPGQNPT